MFSRDYICLVAGLREYTLESDTKGLDLDSLLEEIFEEFSKKDAASVRLLYGYYDCENLTSAFAGRKSYNPMGLISAEMIEAIIRGDQSGDEDPMELIPEGVARVVESYTSKSGEIASESNTESFDRAIFAAYYEACAKSKSKFLRSWSEADRNLRNVAAAITARATERAIEDVVVGGGDVVDQLLRSSAVDFGLRGDLSYIDSVISAVSDEPNMVEKEHKIDQIRWSVVEELVEQEYFSADFVLGYLVKVNIVARWRMLDPERGREMFTRLMDGLSGSELIK
ncbi:MAG: DUF2764 family protein [Rikenellaceae bacterium]